MNPLGPFATTWSGWRSWRCVPVEVQLRGQREDPPRSVQRRGRRHRVLPHRLRGRRHRHGLLRPGGPVGLWLLYKGVQQGRGRY